MVAAALLVAQAAAKVGEVAMELLVIVEKRMVV